MWGAEAAPGRVVTTAPHPRPRSTPSSRLPRASGAVFRVSLEVPPQLTNHRRLGGRAGGERRAGVRADAGQA